jgi:predicted methyltransferase
MIKKSGSALVWFTVFMLFSAWVPVYANTLQDREVEDLLDTIIQSPHRAEANRLRDQYRHPKETLLFFGLRPDMTVVEISPANGWYAEIISPLVKNQGYFYAAVPSQSR